MTFFTVFSKKTASDHANVKAQPLTSRHSRRIRRSRRLAAFA